MTSDQKGTGTPRWFRCLVGVPAFIVLGALGMWCLSSSWQNYLTWQVFVDQQVSIDPNYRTLGFHIERAWVLGIGLFIIGCGFLLWAFKPSPAKVYK